MEAATMDRPATGEQADGAGGEDEQAPHLPEPELTGTQLSFPNLGGKVPGRGTIKLNGGKIKLQAGTSFKKNDTVELRIVCVVNKVGQKDIHDPQTGIVTDSEQFHEARITDIQIVE